MNENLIQLIFSSFSLYDLNTHFDRCKNKTITHARLNILSYDSIFKSMGKSKLTFAEENKELLQSIILPNNVLMSTSKNGSIRFWNIKSGIPIKTLKAEGRIFKSTILPNGNIIACLYDCKIQIWDSYREDFNRVIKIDGYRSFIEVLFLSNGDIVCNAEPGCLIILDSKDNYQCSRILDKRDDGYIDPLFNLSSKLFATKPVNTIKIYDIFNDYKSTIIQDVTMPSISVNNLLFFTFIDITILDINDNHKRIYCLKGHRDVILDLLFIEKDSLLLSGSLDGSIKVWDADSSYKCVKTISTEGYLIRKLLFLKCKYFAASATDNRIRIWDLVNFICIVALEHNFKLMHFELLEDDRILSYSFNGNILIWSY
jgi:WD40 repeat protein